LGGAVGRVPEYRSRSGKLISLQERVNDCFQRSMNGKPLAFDSAEMNAIMAYMKWLSSGVPVGTNVTGRGFEKIDTALVPNREHGKAVYAAQCASCHGADGQGMKNPQGGYVFPPVWGKDSFNIGAGMARMYTAAAFVKHNMPLGQGGTLSAQDALDVSAYFTAQPRPDYAARANDWPKGDKPKDAR
jgi:thiosulfate dehydrogenase